MNIDYEHALAAARSASARAADMLRERYRSQLEITSKGHADFVTDLDHQCEEIIREELYAFDDTIAFVGEETTEFEVVGDQVHIDLPSTCWIVDPLDGTSNYSHSFGAFAVSIALRVDNEIVVSSVEAPVTRDRYFAIEGSGAFHQVSSHSITDPIKMNVIDNGDHFNLFATAAPFRYPEYIPAFMAMQATLFAHCEDIRRVGSAELDLAWVANGSWAAYFEKFLKPWDSSAGSLLVTEAGGAVSDWSGNEKDWLINGNVLATSSPRVHEQILSLIK
jgi:myo-inositol-1(or 4)-monophosphatase